VSGAGFPIPECQPELLLTTRCDEEEIPMTPDVPMRRAGDRGSDGLSESGQRELAEQGLRESEDRYRMLIEQVQDYAIFMLDPAGCVASWNAGAELIMGYRATEIIGEHFSLFYPAEDVANGTPEEVLRSAAATGRHEAEGWRIRKDGSRFRANVVLTALRDSAGGLYGFSEVSRDISERYAVEARYRGLLEAAPDAMVIVNQSGEIVLLNLQAEKVFGYRRDELLGQKVTNIIPVGFAERLLAGGDDSAGDPIIQQMGSGLELHGRRKNGSDFPIEIMLSPLESADGILVTAAIRDITRRKTAEEHLVQMEARYRGLLEAAPDAMVIVNRSGEIVLLNLQAEKVFGYRRDELLGQKVTNIIPVGFAERLLAGGDGSVDDPIIQQMGTGLELHGRRKSGSDFPIEIMLSPLESADGILVTAAIRDITLRKTAEEHLVQMEARYRGLLEAAPDAMVIVNRKGEIVLLNLQAEKVFGYRRDELLGQKVTNIIPVGFAERLLAGGDGSAGDPIIQQMGTGLELHGRRKNGSDFPIEIMLSPLESAEGILVTAAIRDITLRKTEEEHLVQMEARYRGLLEAAPDAMVIVNRSGEIVLLNLQAEKVFGYRRDELLGQKVTNIIPVGFAERLVAGGDGSVDDPIVQQMGTGIELNGRRGDGSEFPIEIMLSPLESAEGILVTAAVRDVTVRKEAERNILRMEAETRRAADAFAKELDEQSRQFGHEFAAMRARADRAESRVKDLEQTVNR
jgi:PAS domain S-box-containing protein